MSLGEVARQTEHLLVALLGMGVELLVPRATTAKELAEGSLAACNCFVRDLSLWID